MNRKGFSLIEMLVVIAVIGILIAIAVPTYLGQQRTAQRNEAFTNLQNLRLLEEQFMAERGRYTISLGTPPTAANDEPTNAFDAADANTRGRIARGGAAANAINSNEALPGFQPGTGLVFTYWIVTGQRFPINTGATPPTATNIAAGDPPCFVAFARGNTSTRVDNEVFAIDCNNNKNF